MNKIGMLFLCALSAGCSTVETIDGAGAGGAPSIDAWEKIDGTLVTLPPHSTQDLCQNFANPFGQDVVLDDIVVRGDPNTELVEVFLTESGHDSGIGSCLTHPAVSIYEGAPQGEAIIESSLAADAGLMIRARFTNTDDNASDGFVIVRLHAR